MAAYAPGFPSRAAAVIVDNDQPRPQCSPLPGGMFHLCRPGTNGYSFTVQASTDLVNWAILCTNVVTDGAVHYVDTEALDFNTRFYRIRSEPADHPRD
jgi:hypothetical protein